MNRKDAEETGILGLVIKRIFQSLGIVFMFLVLFLSWASQSRSGLTWVAGQLPSSVRATGLSGELGDFRFSQLQVDVPGGVLTVFNGHVQWNLFDLMTETIAINHLQAEQLLVALVTRKEPPQPTKTLWQGVELPINIIIRDAAVSNVSITQDDATLVAFDTINLNGGVSQNRLDLQSLILSAPGKKLDLRGTADLRAKPKGRVALEHDIEWRTDQQIITGAGSINGTWQKLEIAQQLSSPWQARFDAHVNDILGQNITWESTLASLAPSQHVVTKEQQGAVVELGVGQLRIEGAYAPEFGFESLRTHIEGSIPVASEGYSAWDADLDVQLDKGALAIRSLKLMQKARSKTDASAHIRSPSAASQVENQNVSAAGLSIEGRIDDLVAFLANKSAVNTNTLQDNATGVNVSGQWSNLSWPLLNDEAGTSTPQAQALVENSNGQFTLLGNTGDYAFNIDAKGVWRNNDFDVKAQLGVGAHHLNIERLDLMAAGARLTAKGLIGDQVDVVADISVPSLQQLHPLAAGDLTANARFKGPRDRVYLEGDTRAGLLQWSGFAARNINLSAKLPAIAIADIYSLSPAVLKASGLQLVLSVGDVSSQSVQLAESINLTAGGSLADHGLDLNLSLPRGASMAAQMAGGVSKNAWSAQLSTLNISNRRNNSWTLQQTAQISVSPNSVTVPKFCLIGDGQRLCAELDLAGDAQTVSADLEKFALSNLDYFLKVYDLNASGQANGSLMYSRGRDNQGELKSSLDANLEAKQAEVFWFDSDADQVERVTLLIDSFTLSADQKESLNVSASLLFANQDSADFTAKFAAPFESPQFRTAAMSGRGTFSIEDLSQLPPSLLNDVSLTGKLMGNLELGGSIDTPAVSLSADVMQATAKVRNLGLSLNDIELRARSNDRSQIDIDGSLKSGEGILNVNGTLRLPQGGSPSLKLKLVGDDVQLANTSEMQINAGVNLTALLDAKLFTFTGGVNVNSAEIDFKVPESALLPSNDVVLLGDEVHANSVLTQLDVTIDLGTKSHVQAQGLDAKLLGKLRVLKQPQGIMRGDGQINISEGRYVAYGQELEISSGVLIFDGGSIDDPNLDLRAQREVETTTVGVSITGRASEPRLNLYSSPTMSDQDILAVLIFKKPISSLESRDALTLLKIADSVNGGGLDHLSKLTHHLEETLGLSALEINLADGSPGLVARKQLTSRFSLSYGYGLLDATQSLFMRYRLSDRWSVKAELGADSGADLRYQIEY